MTTAILIPAMRPHLLWPLLEGIEAATPEEHTVHVAATPEYFDAVRELAPNVEANAGFARHEDAGDTWGHRLNVVYERTSDETMFLGAEDLVFRPGWLTSALEAVEAGFGVVSVNDLHTHVGTHALVSREYLDTESGCIDTPGVIIYPGYHHNFSERELFETAAHRGRFAYCPSSIAEHHHVIYGTAAADDVYALGSSRWNEDLQLFTSRRHLWNGSGPILDNKTFGPPSPVSDSRDGAWSNPANVREAISQGVVFANIGAPGGVTQEELHSRPKKQVHIWRGM